MANKKKEDKKIVFRRIGGRIVPIAVGAGALGLSNRRLLNKADEKAMKAVQKNFTPTAKTTGSFIKTQSKKHFVLQRAYSKEITRYLKKDHKNSLGYKASPVQHNPFSKGSYYSDGVINLKNVDEATFLHEMGHAIQDRKKTKLNP